MSVARRVIASMLACVGLFAGLWLAAGLLHAALEPPTAASLALEPPLQGGVESPAGPAVEAGVAPGVDIEAGRAAARTGFRADADPDFAWLGNPLATPLLIANGPMKSRPVAFRFRAGTDGCVTSFRTWWRYSDPDKPESTYSGGDGGRYRVELRPDDGAGVPSDEVLDAGEFVPDVRRYPNDSHDNQYREVVFGGAACVERGRTYHVVLVNIAPDPQADFVSFNGPYLRDAFQNAAETNACPACTDHAVLRREADGNWILYPDDHTPEMVYLPFWCAALDTGVAIGQSLQYGHAAVDPAPLVGGTSRVRQTFEEGLPGAPTTLRFYARRVAGEAPLEVRVGGRSAGKVTMPMAAGDGRADAREFAWHDVRLDAGAPDGSFDVEFSTAEGSAYELGASVRTARLCGVPVATDVDGRAEVSDDGGATWRGPTVFGKDDKPNVQLSLVLKGDS